MIDSKSLLSEMTKGIQVKISVMKYHMRFKKIEKEENNGNTI